MMKPAIKTGVVLGLTAVGLTLTLRYRTPPAAPTHASPSTTVAMRSVTTPDGPASARVLASARPARPAGAPPPRSVTVTRTVTITTGGGGPAAKADPHQTKAAAGPAQTYTCQTFQAGSFGPVQVAIKIQGTHWADVVNLQLPNGNSTNDQINGYAGPQLRKEALRLENADIQTVSGATYTSDAYRESLQSCINQWSG